jgi:hypothetical protein
VNTGEFLLFFWKAISATPAVFLLHLELLYALYLRKSERATHSAPGNIEFVNGNSVKQLLVREFWKEACGNCTNHLLRKGCL